jgi:hypothetical protein
MHQAGILDAVRERAERNRGHGQGRLLQNGSLPGSDAGPHFLLLASCCPQPEV